MPYIRRPSKQPVVPDGWIEGCVDDSQGAEHRILRLLLEHPIRYLRDIIGELSQITIHCMLLLLILYGSHLLRNLINIWMITTATPISYEMRDGLT